MPERRRRMMRSGWGVALAAVALAAAPAMAGPQQIVEKLKATPASLFDLALARLEAMVGGVGAAHGFSAGAYYQDGGIRISAQLPAKQQSRAACKAQRPMLPTPATTTVSPG